MGRKRKASKSQPAQACEAEKGEERARLHATRLEKLWNMIEKTDSEEEPVAVRPARFTTLFRDSVSGPTENRRVSARLLPKAEEAPINICASDASTLEIDSHRGLTESELDSSGPKITITTKLKRMKRSTSNETPSPSDEYEVVNGCNDFEKLLLKQRAALERKIKGMKKYMRQLRQINKTLLQVQKQRRVFGGETSTSAAETSTSSSSSFSSNYSSAFNSSP